jgi:hypothetical protein
MKILFYFIYCIVYIIQAVFLIFIEQWQPTRMNGSIWFYMPLALMMNQESVNVALALWTFTIPR